MDRDEREDIVGKDAVIKEEQTFLFYFWSHLVDFLLSFVNLFLSHLLQSVPLLLHGLLTVLSGGFHFLPLGSERVFAHIL